MTEKEAKVVDILSTSVKKIILASQTKILCQLKGVVGLT